MQYREQKDKGGPRHERLPPVASLLFTGGVRVNIRRNVNDRRLKLCLFTLAL